MDKMNPILPPNLVSSLNQFYAAQQPDAAFSSRLESQLRHHQIELVPPIKKSIPLHFNARKTFMQTIRTRPMLVILLSILALMALTGVVYALGRLTGFIPGFGFTSGDNTILVLDESADVTSGGIHLHVDQAVNDGQRFWVEMTAEGLPKGWDYPNVFVLLPDGVKVQSQGGTSSDLNASKITLNIEFPSLSYPPQEMTLLIDLAGQSFSIPFKLRPVKSGEFVPLSAGEFSQLQSDTQSGMRLVLDHVAVDSGKTIFQVSLCYDQPNIWINVPWNVTLTDKNGDLYPLTDVTPDTISSGVTQIYKNVPPQSGSTPNPMTCRNTRVYQTLPFSGTEQLVLTLVTFPSSDTVPMFIDSSTDGPAFTFDPGVNPEVGKKWDVNQTLSYSDFKLNVISAILEDGPNIVFEIEPGPSITGALFYSSDPLVTGSSGGVPITSGNVTSGMEFSAIPQHPIEIKLTQIYYELSGSWQIQWQPPAAPAAAPDLLTPTASAAPSLYATPTLASSDPTLIEVQQLAQKFDALFQQGPGWVHVVRETVTNRKAGQTFPPAYIKTEQWFELDQEGYITRSVWLDFDEAGILLQQSATVGNYSVNFTTADSGFNANISSHFSLDTATQDLNAVIAKGAHFSQEEGTCDNGNRCLIITMSENFEQPVQNTGEPQAFYGSGRRIWIDLANGQQLENQSFWLLEDGSEKVTSTTSYILAEKVDTAPQEILNILSRVIVP
jgi:hypothetical protein